MSSAAPTVVRRGLRRRPASRRASSWTLDPRKNSLNLIRLVLASLVIVSHAHPLAGLVEPKYAGATLGTWAVYGFFVISGYLITGSRVRTRFGTYLMLRLARIFPGFLVCLGVTAFVLAPIAWLIDHGSLAGLWTTLPTPLNYVVVNATLQMREYTIAGTLAHVPYPGAWDGSLWTLYYEFLCYLILGVMFLSRRVRSSRWAILGAFVLSVLLQAFASDVARAAGGNGDITFLSELLPCFLGGAVVYVWRDRITLGAAQALVCMLGVLGAAIVAPSWGVQATAPLLAVAALWLASVLPSPRWVQVHDISYGVYVYAFPVQQMLAVLHVNRLGLLSYTLAAIPPTFALATLSWFLVERPALRRAHAGRI